MAYDQVGAQFAQFYYTAMQKDKDALKNLYDDSSCMTFEGTRCFGKAAIMAKVTSSMGHTNTEQSLSFKSIEYNITNVDCQPVGGEDSGVILVKVTGQLKTDDDPPHSFSQSFLLKKGDGSYFIANEMFRMMIHN